MREAALFDLGFGSKLRGGDLVALKVSDVSSEDCVATRTVVPQPRTQRPVIWNHAGQPGCVAGWIKPASLKSDDLISLSRVHD